MTADTTAAELPTTTVCWLHPQEATLAAPACTGFEDNIKCALSAVVLKQLYIMYYCSDAALERQA